MSMAFNEVVPFEAAAPRPVEVIEAPMGEVVLTVDDLTVRFPSDEGPVLAVQNLSYEAVWAAPWPSSGSPAPGSPSRR